LDEKLRLKKESFHEGEVSLALSAMRVQVNTHQGNRQRYFA
jgi:hypothetical protein